MPTSVAANFLSSLDHSDCGTYPFRHWLLDRILPRRVCEGIDALPVSPPAIEDTAGKRETHNSSRLFFGEVQRAAHPVCDMLAHGLQSDAVVRGLETLCDVCLGGSFLRIEYCLDTQGFWLEPHTDIGAKLFTMLVYLSDDPGSEAWGTDLLDGPDHLVGTTPYQRNRGFIFHSGCRYVAWVSPAADRGCPAVVDRELCEGGMAGAGRAGVSEAAGAAGGGGLVSFHAGWNGGGCGAGSIPRRLCPLQLPIFNTETG